MQRTASHTAFVKKQNIKHDRARTHDILRVPIKLWSTLLVAYQHRRAAAELEALDDHLLKDIGICRTEIHSFVRYRRDDDKPLVIIGHW
jgi:uncharacterized protein YjiS (DUF1127 family)